MEVTKSGELFHEEFFVVRLHQSLDRILLFDVLKLHIHIVFCGKGHHCDSPLLCIPLNRGIALPGAVVVAVAMQEIQHRIFPSRLVRDTRFSGLCRCDARNNDIHINGTI